MSNTSTTNNTNNTNHHRTTGSTTLTTTTTGSTSTNELSSSMFIRITTCTMAVATAVVVTAAMTMAFRIGYQRALLLSRRNIREKLSNATSGCIIFQDGYTNNKKKKNRKSNRKKNDVSNSSNSIRIPAPRRFGSCIQLKSDKYIEYRILHDNVWDDIQLRLYRSHIRNFTIYYHKETSTLFQHFEWIGHWDFNGMNNNNNNKGTTTVKTKRFSVEEEQALLQADFDAIAQDPITRQWWKLCEPCQTPFAQWYHQTPPPPPPEGEKGNDKNVTLQTLPSDGNNCHRDWWATMECICHTGHYPTSYSRHRRDIDFVPLPQQRNTTEKDESAVR